MKIRVIDMWNFRQFHGRATLRLACDDERNVTLIHAENGIGKTTVLNAVFWAMFGDVTPRFEQRSRIINFEAEREGATEARVEVEFEFGDRTYRVSRCFVAGKKEAEMRVWELNVGSMVPLRVPETFIGSVIPKAMARYFFFDGEHAESFAAEQNQTAGAAIRSMLGCDLADEGIKDLKEVARQFTRQMGDAGGDEELAGLKDALGRLEEEQLRDEAALQDHRKSIELFIEQRNIIDEYLRRVAGAREIQDLRDGLQKSKDQCDKDLHEAEGQVVTWIGERAIATISRKAQSESAAFMTAAAVEGRLPSPYREDFIQGLLDRELCICGCDLKPMTKEFASVATLKKGAGNTQAENRLSRVRARLQALQETARNAPRLLRNAQERVATLLETRRSLEQRLGEASRKLETFNLDEVREKETARIQLEKQVQERSRHAGSVEQAMESRKNAIDAQVRRIEAKAAKNEKAHAVMLRRGLALQAAKELQDLLSIYERQARDDIEREINGILERTARRDYRFGFDEDFTMSLLHADVDGPVPKSGGENQLMSLAFTAALVRFAKARQADQNEILTPGIVAPLVLDAPIGHLDHSYRRATAAFIPEMAGQVVLLLSSAHITDGVMEALQPRIGKEYILVSENRRAQDGKGDDAIDIRGRRYARSLFNQERNLTRIEEVG